MRVLQKVVSTGAVRKGGCAVKFIESEHFGRGDVPVVELTRRNRLTLLDKLDDPKSQRMLLAPGDNIIVRAVEDEEHYSDRSPSPVFMPSAREFR